MADVGMRVVFGNGFDGGVWPAVGARVPTDRFAGSVVSATFDEAWVGRRGLLRLLETALGLGAAAGDVTQAERSASLLPALRERRGAWSRSLDTDPLAVARSLLRLRDVLVDAGLDPRADLTRIPQRLRDVIEVTAQAPAGAPDRLRAVNAALVAVAAQGTRIDIARVEMVGEGSEESAGASPAWRRVLAGLRAVGVEVVARAVQDASSDPALDVTRARGRDGGAFRPRGDGSLALLRADCPEEAAIEVAAHLAALTQDGGDEAVVIGGDAVLDAGLSRMGMPTLGARGGRGEDGLLQVAPLVVALAWPERDPERAFELLTLSSSPIRRVVGSRLARALTKEPAVESDAWQRALADALALVPEAEQARVTERIGKVFGAGAPGSARAGYEMMPLEVLDARLQIVRGWLFGRMQREAEPVRLRAAVAQIIAIGRVARAFGAPALSRVELMRVVEQATSSVRPTQPRPSLAGLHRVADPAALTAPAAHVVWWNFLASSESLPFAPAFTSEERTALLASGVEVPDPGALAERRAAAFARPLACASTSLVLVCPRRDEGGDDAHPHPLWDEIVARAGGDAAVRALEVRELVSARTLTKKAFKGRDVAQPQREWRFPAGTVKRPERESPSSREILVGCTIRAVFERSGLRSLERRLPEGQQLFGDLAHDVIGAVLTLVQQRAREGGSGAGPVTPQEAAARARVVFDEKLPRRAAVLARPEEATQRARARELCARAAERLVALLQERALAVVSVEKEIERGVEGRKMVGRPDLVVGDAAALARGIERDLVVVDLKSGGDRWRRKSLEDGLALQLVAYAGMLAKEGLVWPGVAYFQIRSRRVLTTDARLGGVHVLEPKLTVSQTAQRVRKTATAAEAEIEGGRADAPGVGKRLDELRSSVTEEGELLIAPPCHYCRYSMLCGRALPGGTSPSAGNPLDGSGREGRS